MSAAAWAAVISGCTLVATIWLGISNLRRTARGPRGTPQWHIAAVGGSVRDGVALTNKGTAAATNVKMSFSDSAARVDGPQQWERFDVGQREVFLPVFSWGTAAYEQRMWLTWTSCHDGDPGQWESSVPTAE